MSNEKTRVQQWFCSREDYQLYSILVSKEEILEFISMMSYSTQQASLLGQILRNSRPSSPNNWYQNQTLLARMQWQNNSNVSDERIKVLQWSFSGEIIELCPILTSKGEILDLYLGQVTPPNSLFFWVGYLESLGQAPLTHTQYLESFY